MKAGSFRIRTTGVLRPGFKAMLLMSALVGCAGTEGADPQAHEDFDEVIGQHEQALFEDHFDLANGARVELALFAGKAAVVSVAGKTGT